MSTSSGTRRREALAAWSSRLEEAVAIMRALVTEAPPATGICGRWRGGSQQRGKWHWCGALGQQGRGNSLKPAGPAFIFAIRAAVPDEA